VRRVCPWVFHPSQLSRAIRHSKDGRAQIDKPWRAGYPAVRDDDSNCRNIMATHTETRLRILAARSASELLKSLTLTKKRARGMPRGGLNGVLRALPGTGGLALGCDNP